MNDSYTICSVTPGKTYNLVISGGYIPSGPVLTWQHILVNDSIDVRFNQGIQNGTPAIETVARWPIFWSPEINNLEATKSWD